jgi:PleD family two-component response regulator
MFGQALNDADALPEDRRGALVARLSVVRHLGHNLGYGVGDDMDDLLARYGGDAKSR